MVFHANDVLTKPVYDVAFYGQDVIIPLGTDTLTLQSITWSALDQLRQVSPANADAHIEDYPRLISDIDTLGIANEGDGVRFSRTYEWLTDMSAFVYKFSITMCVALDVTAYTSGAHSVDQVRLIITERDKAGNLIKTIADATQATGMADTAAIETRAAIMHFEGNTPFKVSQGNIVRFEITFTSTDTQTATSFEGIMPWFYFQAGSLAKTMSASAIILHLHPALDHAFEVLRDESITELLDYSGVNRDGDKR